MTTEEGTTIEVPQKTTIVNNLRSWPARKNECNFQN